MTGYLYRGDPGLEELNAAIMAARVRQPPKWSRGDRAPHGTPGAYKSGCRCEACRQAESRRRKARKAAA